MEEAAQDAPGVPGVGEGLDEDTATSDDDWVTADPGAEDEEERR